MPRPYAYGPADVYDAKHNQGAKLIPHRCPYNCFERVQTVHKRVAQLEAQINVLFSALKEFLKEDEPAAPVPRPTLPIKTPILAPKVLKRTIILNKRSAESSQMAPSIFSTVKDEDLEEPTEKRFRTESVEDRAPVLEDEGTSALDLMNDYDEEENFDQDLDAPKLEESEECGTSALALMYEDEVDDGEEAPRLEMAETPPPTLEKMPEEGDEESDEDEEVKETEFEQVSYITERDIKKALMKTSWMGKGEPMKKAGKFWNPSDKKKVLTEQQLNLFAERALLLTDAHSEITATKPYLTPKMLKESTTRLCKLGMLLKVGPKTMRKENIHDSKEFALGLAHRGISLEEYLKTLSE